MLKNLKLYYIYIASPFILLMLGVAYFFDIIKMTIARNPHPQVNYTIFAIILFGGILIINCARLLMRDAMALNRFTAAIRAKTDLATLQEMALNFDGDISYVLRMLASTGGRPISVQEQTAIEHELAKATTRLSRRNALPQYLVGLLVGMGLLGTFIGLLATLADISELIGSFAQLNMATADPIVVFGNMIERMKAPMQSMGIAFSASMFGLLGSIILGLMMVSIRRFQGDINSVLGSEVAQHIEFALSHEGFAYSKKALKLGLGQMHDGAITARDVIARPVEPVMADKTTAPSVDITKGAAPDNALTPVDPPSTGTSANTDTTGDSTSTALAAASSVTDMAGNMVDMVGTITARGDKMDGADGTAAGPTFAPVARASRPVNTSQDNHILLRIEERLAETARMQFRTLNNDIDEFQKQRADLLRLMTEQTEASNNFRGELQRVGRQLGSLMAFLDKNQNESANHLVDIKVCLNTNTAETHKLMSEQLADQQQFQESLRLLIENAIK